MEENRLEAFETNASLGEQWPETARVFSARKVIYAAVNILTVMAGTLLGVLGGIMVGLMDLKTADDYRMYGYDSKRHFVERFGDILVKDLNQSALMDYFSTCILRAVVLVMVFIAGVVILSVLTGRFRRNEDGTIHLNLFDRMWKEVTVFLLCLASGTAISCAIPIVGIVHGVSWFGFYTPMVSNNQVLGINNATAIGLAVCGMAAGIEVALACWLSIIKTIKAHKFMKTSVMGKACLFIYESVTSINRDFSVPHEDDEKAGRKLATKYMTVLIAMACFAYFVPFVGLVADIALIAVFVPKKIRQFIEIRKGVIEAKSGHLAYRIPVEYDEKGPKTEFDKLALDVNEIAGAADAAMRNEMKNQRTKIELISNVSHDLRTPMTSILSYVDILKTEGLDSPDAEEYLNIIDDKARHLKDLTDNLFEAAKAASGDVPCELTELDMSAIVNQELAEMGDLMEKNNLKVITKVTALNTRVKADGRHLARVLENVFGNVSKYALEGSRVYVDVLDGKGSVIVEVKNVSRDELNISPDELMERFKRGDESRNTDGSGLGLAIAKDLTELMGGRFGIVIEGDLFKSVVELPAA